MTLYIDGYSLPYIDVAYEFARNPARYSYELKTWHSGTNLVSNKRLEGEEVSIPIILSRRGNERKSWEDIIEELTGGLYSDEPKRVSFGEGKYYLAQVVALEIAEEHEYVAKGAVVIVPEINGMLGEEKAEILSEGSSTIIVEGQRDVAWTAEITFERETDYYELSVGKTKILLNYVFVKGDILTINYGDRSVKIRGRDIAPALDIRSKWALIKRGRNSVNTTEEVKITYDKRYY